MTASALAAPLAWQSAIRGAVEEIATFALSFRSSAVGGAVEPTAVTGLVGAHIPLLGGPSPLELALVGRPDQCRDLAAAMLQAADPSSISEPDTADAVCEILNMLAGSVKRRVSSGDLELALGLPVFVVGHVASTDKIAITPLPARFGAIEMFVLVVGRR